MTKVDLISLIAELHNPELAMQEGHVTQIWNDGEITTQKGGDLLWVRSLHIMEVGLLPPRLEGTDMPLLYNGFGHAFVTPDDADLIRTHMAN